MVWALMDAVPLLSLPLWYSETRILLESRRKPLWEMECHETDTETNYERLAQIVVDLACSLRDWKQKSLKRGLESEYKLLVQTEIFSMSPQSVAENLFALFHFYFTFSSDQYCKHHFISVEDPMEEEEAESMEENQEPEATPELIETRSKALSSVCNALHELYLLRLCEPIVMQVCCNQIQTLINTHCRSGESFESGRLQQVRDWLNVFAFNWIKQIFEPLKLEVTFHSLFSSLCTRLEFFAHESFANLRISELFDIIIDFPDSLPALHDLKECLIKTNQLSHLIESLSQSFQKRLLHQGANTTDIIVQFINMIKALRVLDPTILSIDKLSQPIRNYLQKRGDSIRCAVTMFTNENSELYQELTEGQPSDDDPAKVNNEEWHPLPTHSLITNAGGSMPPRDTFSHLVHIFGSKDLFVGEYRNMLAERLLTITDFRVEREMRIIELLKVRFGDQTLQNCDIMIKDVAFSKRMNKLVHDERQNINHMQAMIISHLFWPAFREDTLKLPPPVAELFKEYHKGYRNIKRDRKIEWIPFLGSVDLDLELNGELRSVTVNPFQATILYHFQEKSQWCLSELAEVMGIRVESVRKKITFWVGQGVLQTEGKDVYRLREKGDDEPVQITTEEEGESSLNSAEDEKGAMWALCFNFINACLTNQGPMAVDKIHVMLSCLMRDDYKATVQELRAFLSRKVKEDVLEFEDNQYKSKE